METDILMAKNYSSLYSVLSDFVHETFIFLTEIDIKTIGVSLYMIVTVIGVSLYIFRKLKDKMNKSITRKRRFHNKSEKNDGLERKNYDYQQVLSEFHDASHKCTNLFSSMKCVQFSSTYPELINVKLLPDGVTPFHRVCSQGNEPLIEFMLAKGADPELKTVAGENALCIALNYYLCTKSKDFSCLYALYNKGCYLSRSDEWYDIFLNLAAKSNNKHLVDWILFYSKPPRTKSPIRASSAPI